MRYSYICVCVWGGDEISGRGIRRRTGGGKTFKNFYFILSPLYKIRRYISCIFIVVIFATMAYACAYIYYTLENDSLLVPSI